MSMFKIQLKEYSIATWGTNQSDRENKFKTNVNYCTKERILQVFSFSTINLIRFLDIRKIVFLDSFYRFIKFPSLSACFNCVDFWVFTRLTNSVNFSGGLFDQNHVRRESAIQWPHLEHLKAEHNDNIWISLSWEDCFAYGGTSYSSSNRST